MAILSLNPDFDDPMHFPGVIKEITPDGKVKVDVTVGSFTTHRTFALATLAPDPNGVGWIIVPPGQPSSSTPSL